MAKPLNTFPYEPLVRRTPHGWPKNPLTLRPVIHGKTMSFVMGGSFSRNFIFFMDGEIRLRAQPKAVGSRSPRGRQRAMLSEFHGAGQVPPSRRATMKLRQRTVLFATWI